MDLIFLNDRKERLDKFLTLKIPDFSRSQIQKKIKDGIIRVNGEKVSSHFFLKNNDKIKLDCESLAPKEIQHNFQLNIIAESDDYLIINKPAGLIIHGNNTKKQLTLVDLILKKYPKIKNIGDSPLRPGIVHRLDKNVSGLMVIAKTQIAFEDLKKQFQSRTVIKKYLALSYEKFKTLQGQIDFPLIRAQNGKMAALPKNSNIPGARQALTEFKVLESFSHYSLLSLIIKTGRTHQIRAHLAAYNHPIIGDDLYSTKMTRILNKKLKTNRVFLFSCYLEFKNLLEENIKYELPMEDELKNLLIKIKNKNE